MPMISLNSLINLHSTTINTCCIHYLHPKLIYSAKIHLQLIWTQPTIRSFCIYSISYIHWFQFPNLTWASKGFSGKLPPNNANVVLQDLRSRHQKDHKHFQHTDSCPRLHLISRYFKCLLHFLVLLPNSLASFVGKDVFPLKKLPNDVILLLHPQLPPTSILAF